MFALPSVGPAVRSARSAKEEEQQMANTSLTWLGHASFRLDSPGGKRIYVDPWLGNPKCPDSEKEPERIDVIALTHGHSDHVGETVELSKRFSPEIVALVELKGWLGSQGAAVGELPGPNKGGSVEAAGIRFTITNAFHSSSSDAGDYLGEAAGIVIRMEDGTSIYFAGDTCVFGDMALIARLYEPSVAVLPIGGHFTMDPNEAAVALELLGNPRCVPCHYGTFGLLRGTPDELRNLAPRADVIDLAPGGTIEL
jgi:L-ascorbate metabolism protein UlaG (beta-lactamase superfamily)